MPARNQIYHVIWPDGGSSLSGIFASKPGRDFSKTPVLTAKMHPLWTIWAKRPEYRGIVPSMGLDQYSWVDRMRRHGC